MQAKLHAKGPNTKGQQYRRSEAMLVSILYDGHGRRMTPSQTNKGAKRYRYYTTQKLGPDSDAIPAWRVPAHDLEQIVVNRLVAFLTNANKVCDAIGATEPSHIQRATAEASRLASLLDSSSTRTGAARMLLERLDLTDTAVNLKLRTESIDPAAQPASITLTAPIVRIKMYKEARLVVLSPAARPAAAPQRDERLVQLLAEAFATRDLLFANPRLTIKDIAQQHGMCRKRFAQLLRISWLDPDIIRAALGGKQPASLTARRLITAELPAAWQAQHAMLLQQPSA
ncbi:hypothetical protein IP88_05415 [alpha proteobacterium AAP81b]|nr:hypothetical protein IP88_05415 [alpha proteobacterium AAP81b]